MIFHNLLMTFSAVIPHNRGIKTGVAQTISCSLGGLGVAADVKWIDPDGVDIPAGDSTDFIVEDGKNGFNGGSQTSKLTLKSTKTQIDAAKTYQCAVTPLLFGGSDAFNENVVVTPIGQY
jgi:hypothetical protein